jgi:hypothetical protein
MNFGVRILYKKCLSKREFMKIVSVTFTLRIQQEKDSSPETGLTFGEESTELLHVFFLSTAVYGAETWTLRPVDQKDFQSFEMCCWRRMDKISWTNCLKK